MYSSGLHRDTYFNDIVIAMSASHLQHEETTARPASLLQQTAFRGGQRGCFTIRGPWGK